MENSEMMESRQEEEEELEVEEVTEEQRKKMKGEEEEKKKKQKTVDVAKEPQSAIWMVVIITALFASGVFDLFYNAEPNGCAMTYMYEIPAYVPIKMPDDVAKRHPYYGLYVYGEGKLVEDLEAEKFTGIPVLFIPGNSGSYKQIRSLASVALRKSVEESEYKTHFDYFSVDFNEEIAALYGGSLARQAEYVSTCVDHILNKLYDGRKQGAPKSVILVGHSIGGLIAKSLFAHSDFQEDKVSTIITLATPHEPVLVLDRYTREFYDTVNAFWNNTSSAASLSHLTFVSIGGGERDILVRSGLTSSSHADVNVISTDASGIWVSADHLCIVWCKQLVLALNRALFDVIDAKTGQISTDTAHRRTVFFYHLQDRRGGKKYREDYLGKETLKFDRDGFWTDILKRQFSFQREHVSTDSYVMIKVMGDDPKHAMVSIDATNLVNSNWLFGCKASTVYKQTRICDSGVNLSGKYTKIVPSKGNRRVAHVNLHKVAKKHGYTHLVVFVPKKSENVNVHIDVYGAQDRKVSYSTPRWIMFWKAYTIVERTPHKAVYYNISLTDVDEPWQAYKIRVKPINNCVDTSHYGLMRFVTPWSNDATQTLIGTSNMTNEITARLQTPKPTDGESYYPNPEVQIYLNPSCRYQIEIQASLPSMFGQIARFYAPMLLPLSIAAILVTLSQQLKSLETDYAAPSFLSTITKKVTPVSVVMPGRILSSMLSVAAIAAYVPTTDFVRLVQQGTDFAVLPIVLFFVCIGLVSVIGAAAWACVVLFGNTANKAATRFVAGYTGVQNEIIVDAAVGGINKFPFILSGILLGVSVATCGDVGLCLGTFCNFVHLFDMYKDYLKCVLNEGIGEEEDAPKRKKAKDSILSSIHFHFTLSLLWVFVTVLNAPSLLAWSRIAPTSQFSPDPSLPAAVVMAASLAATWGAGRPDPNLAGYGKLSFMIQFLAVLVVTYGSLSMYRVNYFVSAVFVVVAAHQLGSSKRPTKEENEAVAASLADKSWAELSTEEQEAAIQDLATKKGDGGVWKLENCFHYPEILWAQLEVRSYLAFAPCQVRRKASEGIQQYRPSVQVMPDIVQLQERKVRPLAKADVSRWDWAEMKETDYSRVGGQEPSKTAGKAAVRFVSKFALEMRQLMSNGIGFFLHCAFFVLLRSSSQADTELKKVSSAQEPCSTAPAFHYPQVKAQQQTGVSTKPTGSSIAKETASYSPLDFTTYGFMTELGQLLRDVASCFWHYITLSRAGVPAAPCQAQKPKQDSPIGHSKSTPSSLQAPVSQNIVLESSSTRLAMPAPVTFSYNFTMELSDLLREVGYCICYYTTQLTRCGCVTPDDNYQSGFDEVVPRSSLPSSSQMVKDQMSPLTFSRHFAIELCHLLRDVALGILHYATLRPLRSGAAKVSAVAKDTQPVLLDTVPITVTSASGTDQPACRKSLYASIKVSKATSRSSPSTKSQGAIPEEASIQGAASTSRVSEGDVSSAPPFGVRVFPTATTHFALNFFKELYFLHKNAVLFFTSLLPSLLTIKKSAMFNIFFARDFYEMLIYAVKSTIYYLFSPFPLRILNALKSYGIVMVLNSTLIPLKFTVNAVLSVLKMCKTIFAILFIAREEEAAAEEEENENKQEAKDLPELKLDADALKDIEFKSNEPAIKSLPKRKEQPKSCASEKKVTIAKAKTKAKPEEVNVPLAVNDFEDDFEYEMPEMVKESRLLASGGAKKSASGSSLAKSRHSSSEQETNTRKKDYSTEEADSAYNSAKITASKRRAAITAANQRLIESSEDEEAAQQKQWKKKQQATVKKETRDGACQTSIDPVVTRRSFRDSSTDPMELQGPEEIAEESSYRPPSRPRCNIIAEHSADKRTKSRHSSGHGGFYSSDDLSECSDFIPDMEYLRDNETSPPGVHQQRPKSCNEPASSPRLDISSLPLQRSSSNVSVSRGPEGTLELSIPLNLRSGKAGDDGDFSKAIRSATDAFEKSLVEAADNFSRNLAAMKKFEAEQEEYVEDERPSHMKAGLQRSYSEHYLPAVSVPDFAEVAFDAIRRAQKKREIEDKSSKRSSYLEEIGQVEKRNRSKEMPLPPRRIEPSDMPSLYRPAVGFRARSLGPDPLHSSVLVKEARSRSKEMLHELDEKMLDRKRMTRSLRQQNAALTTASSLRRTNSLKSSEPYSPLRDYHSNLYHRSSARFMPRLTMTPESRLQAARKTTIGVAGAGPILGVVKVTEAHSVTTRAGGRVTLK